MAIKIRNMYERVYEPANLYRAAHVTLLKGLRFRPKGAEWKKDMEYHVHGLYHKLKNRSYRHGSYEVFKVYDPKERVILAAPLSDRVVHHAVHDLIEPVIDRKFIAHSYACRRGKGQHIGLKKAQSFLRGYDYFIHLDVKKYFYSIHRPTLKQIMRRTVHDEGIDWLLSEIIDSSTRHPYSERTALGTQTELFAAPPAEIPKITNDVRGLPIGNLCSQLFANWYLNELDQFVKHQLKHHPYLRYMDDFVLFSNDKRQLMALEREITDYCLHVLKLYLHPSGGASVYRNGLTFLGFRIFRDHIRVKPASVRRFTKRLVNDVATIPYRSPEGFEQLYRKVQSWNAHVQHADSFGLRRQVLGRYKVTAFMHRLDFDYKLMRGVLSWN